jgi:hypothetical protein
VWVHSVSSSGRRSAVVEEGRFSLSLRERAGVRVLQRQRLLELQNAGHSTGVFRSSRHFVSRRVGIAHHSCVAWTNGGQCPPYAANEYRAVCRPITAQNCANLERQRVLQFALRRALPLTSCGAMVIILQRGDGSHKTRCKTSEFCASALARTPCP